MNKGIKKIISVFMTIVLVLGTFAVYPFAAETADIIVKTNRDEYLNDEPVTATVYFPALYNKVASLDMVLKYDATRLSVVSVEDGLGLKNALKEQTNGRVYSEGHNHAGEIKWSLAGTNNFNFNGTFSIITFKVKTSAQKGDVDLTLNAIRAVNSGYNSISIKTKSAKIKVIKPAVLDLKYELTSDKRGYQVVGYTGLSSDSISIPNKYIGLPVIGIASSAFGSHAELKQVSLPNTLEFIGKEAFNNCSSITSIRLPDTVNTIGEGAFNGCTALKSITLPVGLKTIEKNTFYNCSFLEKIEIPFTVTKILDGAFENCYSLAEIKISRNTTHIALNAFKECFPNAVFKTAEDNKTLPEYLKNNAADAKIEFYKDLSKGTAALSSNKMQYTGNALRPAVNVTLANGEKVSRGTDYTLTYKDNINNGTATVYVAGTGKYGEGYIISFEIYCEHRYSKKTVGLKATCINDGYNNCYCEICDEIVKEIIPALGHKESEWKYDKRPTIHSDGTKFTNCTRCGTTIKSGVSVAKAFPDLNNDKLVNSSDALIVLQYSTDIKNSLLTERSRLNADTNGDGSINSSDALDILMISIGKIEIEGYTV